MKNFFCIMAIVGSLCVAKAQDSTFARGVIRDLTSASFHGRSAAFRGDAIAADYLVEKLKTFGAKPFADGYKQPYAFDICVLDGKVELSIDGKKVAHGSDFSPAGTTKACKGKFPILYFDAEQLSDDAAVAIFRMQNSKTIAKSFVYIDVSEENDLNKTARRKLNELKRGNDLFGSAGVLLGVGTMPAMSIPADVKPMDFCLLYIKNSLMMAKPKRLKVRIDNRYTTHQTQNVAAYVEGRRCKDSMVVFMGHYDHVGQVGRVVYPGAHDNASGAAAVLDLARHFSSNPSDYTTVFLFFSGEESGLMGSSYFVQNPLFDLSKVKFMVNIDLFCGGDEGIMVFNAEADNTKAFFARLKAANAEHGYVADVEPRKNAANSDHYPFVAKGMPAVFVLTKGGVYGGYHSPDDTCDRCQIQHYNNILHLILEALGL